jgi:hypothetical protein
MTWKNKVEKECKGKEKKKDRCPAHAPPARPPVGKVPTSGKAAWLKTANGKKWNSWNSKTKAYYNKKATANAKDACLRALRCKLVPWSKAACCPGQTPHHLIEQNSFDGISPYNAKKAPCVCVEGTSWHEGSHALMHTMQGGLNKKTEKAGKISLKQARKNGAKAVKKVFPESGCSQKCLEAQIKNGHKPLKDSEQLKSNPSGYTSDAAVAKAEAKVQSKLDMLKNLKKKGTGR